ncbi:sugar ABC transporter substrate-binding protein [Patulibacter defluvii]|uniref:sugar ABC transporter substrate-binding protein n=1 Tax=Patulibacter defluvii TaxID=3095358 RepID=UPI002A765059|nr:sugar ABC transporter substrate-binding protein [Patulibacter sp. DM4]
MVRSFTGAAAVLAALALAACGGDDGGSGDKSGGASGGGGGGAKKVAYSNPVAGQPGQEELMLGFTGGAKELGWKATQINANLSPDKQVADIATMISQKQDGIASWTLDPGAAAGAYGQARSAGIPVIGVNSEGEGVSTSVWWELNTCENDPPIGRTAKMIAESRPKAKVIMIGGPPVPSIKAYEDCFAKEAKAAGLQVVAKVANTKDTAATAQPLTADVLTKHPDADAIWAYNDQSALGASAAVTSASKKVSDGKSDGIMVFGQNGDEDAITAIKDGRLTATWDTDAIGTGWAVIKALTYYIGDAKTDNPPKNLVVKSTMWTKDNVGEYVPPRQRKYTVETAPLLDQAGQ